MNQDIERLRETAESLLCSRSAARQYFDDSLGKMILACARAAHEANRLYCASIGDDSQASWIDAADWQKESAVAGVGAALAGATPKELHESWCAKKREDGWTFGETKDAEAKTHPCLIDYEDLPPEQKIKDALFSAVVQTISGHFKACVVAKFQVDQVTISQSQTRVEMSPVTCGSPENENFFRWTPSGKITMDCTLPHVGSTFVPGREYSVQFFAAESATGGQEK